tara:strand:- start:1476 stop:3362 length:1887 start_codon:yes stop_codon:yes gene_type:complete
VYHGNQTDVLSEAGPKGGDLWYDTTFSTYSVLRYYNAETDSWVLVQDYNTGASKNSGQEMFGDNTLCGSVTFSYASYVPISGGSSSSSSSGSSSQHCGTSSSEEASSSGLYAGSPLSEAQCVSPYAIFDGEMQSLGIGNLYPETILHVSNDGSEAVLKIGQHYDGVTGPRLDLLHTRGTFLIPQDIQALDTIGSVRAKVYDSSVMDEVILGIMSWSAGPTVSGSSTLSIKTHDGTSLTEVISVDEDGNVSIPTLSGGGSVSVLDDLTDVTISSPSDRQILIHDGSGWVNEAEDSLYCRVYNNTASTLSKGGAVYVTGAHNQNVLYVDLAQADAAATMPCIGLVYEDIAVNDEGLIVTFSKAQGVNTSSFTEGDIVYVDTSTAGDITNVKPTGVNDLIQNIGVVSKSHATNGVVKVTGVGRANDTPNTIDIPGDITTTGDVNAATVTVTGGVDFNSFTIPYSGSILSDGTMLVYDSASGEMKEWLHGGQTTIGFYIDGDGAAIATGAKLDALRQVDKFLSIERVRLYSPDGVTSVGTSTTVQIMLSTDIDDTEANIDSAATALIVSGAAATSLSFTQPKSGTSYETLGSTVTAASGHAITPDDFIYPKVTANGQSLTKVHIFIELKATV